MKKILTILLALIIVLSMVVPAFANETSDDLPLVYFSGRGCSLVRPDGTYIWEPEGSVIDNMKDNLSDIAKLMVKGNLTRNFDEFNDLIYDCVAPVYSDSALGKDGFPTDGSTVPDHLNWRLGLDRVKTTIALDEGRYPVYRWHYDWRLSPITLADELNDYINAVLDETGAEQVNILSRCEGSTITYCYLYKYGTDKVHSCVLNSDITNGLDFTSSLFSGEIVIDPAALNNFVQFFAENQNITINNEETTDMLLDLISFLQSAGVLKAGTELLEFGFDTVKDDLITRILKSSFATFPAYWAMVTPDKYEKAKQFVFGSDSEEYSGLIRLTDEYFVMQKNSVEFLKSISDEVNICIISKYGMPEIPLSENATEESDIYLATRLSSYGATCADFDGTLSGKYIAARTEEGYGKYISPDCKIDASTCALPDTTWFIKGMAHRCFAACVDTLSVEFVNSENMTVFNNEKYPQFLQFTATNDSLNDAEGYLTPIAASQPDNTGFAGKILGRIIDPFVKFREFLKSFFRFIKTVI
ncbi:MAG: hypothetical protein IJS17_05310 [Clostridia bacterium]|nr:hypothetical protein [Clostridia bacterium]